jgi:hypothetical protein
MAIIDLDWHFTGILKVRHPCLMWTFMNYSACWRSKKVLVSTSDVTPLISRQNRVVIVSSVIAKILNSSKCWTVTIKPFWMTLLLISAHCYYLLPVICCLIFVQCLFASVFSFQFNSFVQYSYHPVNVQSPPDPGNEFQVFRSCKQQSSAVNKHHTPDNTNFCLSIGASSLLHSWT